MKKGSGKAKGGAFERLICKKLSLWWTHNKRDDVFYRTASSGGRATQRSKKGKHTHGQYGDIQAVDPIGQPLMDLCVIECKDGYAGDSIADLLDKETRHNPKYEQFIEQVRQSYRDSTAEYWMLIARRRGRQIMVFMPVDLWDSIADSMNSDLTDYYPTMQLSTKHADIMGVQLYSFLNRVHPKAFGGK